MKLKCKVAHEEAHDGFLGFGAQPRRPIEGLTAGKEYTGNLVPIVYRVMNDGTTIDESDIKAMIYDDNEKWKAYPLRLFEPA